MKSFIFTITKSNRDRMNGGLRETAKIYRIKRNTPEYVGAVSWHTASTCGEESEVMQELVRLQELPHSVLKMSVSACSGAGYYKRQNGKFSIKKIG